MTIFPNDIYLHMIIPETITDATFTSSTIPETDYAAWADATAYVIGNTRIITATGKHWVIYCILGHTSAAGGPNDPTVDINTTTGAGTYWLKVSMTNKWKITNAKLKDQSIFAGTITDIFTPTNVGTAVVLFNVEASSAQVKVTAAGTGIIRQTQNKEPVEFGISGGIVDWWTYFYIPITYKYEMIWSNMPIFPGDALQVQVSGLATNKIGEIIYGVDHTLGKCLFPLGIGTIDYSTKETDTFGNVYVVARAFSSRAEYEVLIPSFNANRIKRLLSNVRAIPVVFYTHSNDNDYGSLVFGYIKNVEIVERSINQASLSISVEGLI